MGCIRILYQCAQCMNIKNCKWHFWSVFWVTGTINPYGTILCIRLPVQLTAIHSIREWVVKRSAAEECRSRSYSKNWVLWIFMHARILSVAVFLLSYCSLGYQNTSWHTCAFSIQRVFRACAWTVCRRSTSRICRQVADQKTPHEVFFVPAQQHPLGSTEYCTARRSNY